MKMVSLLKSAKKQPYLNMFKKKRNNNGVMWASLISIGISALMMMLGKGKREKFTSSFQNLTKNITEKSSNQVMNNMPLTEFAEELNLGKNLSKDGATNGYNAEKTEFSKENDSLDIPVNANISQMNDSALTDFSEELLSKAIENK
jgi:hypothetical protein